MTVTETPVRPPIDPRLRARRIAIRRDEGRRRLRRLTALAVAGVVLLALLGSTRSPLLDVDRIRVEGALHTPVDAVNQASGLHRHQPMTDVDLDRARRGIAALPWIATVSVQRHWPGSVTVKVTERTPIAAVAGAPGVFALVDASGRVLEVDPTPPAGTVVITGVAAPGAAGTSLADDAADALAVARVLPPALAAKITGVALGPDGVQLALAAGGTVKIGPASDVTEKLVAVNTVLEQVDVHDLCTLDVRVASAPSLTEGTPCA